MPDRPAPASLTPVQRADYDRCNEYTQELIDRLGYDAALEMRHRYGMCSVYLTGAEQAHRIVRDRRICDAYDAGHKAAVVARRYGVSESHVRKTWAKHGPKSLPLPGVPPE